MIYLRYIFKGLLLIYFIAIIVYIATADWLYDDEVDTPIYRINVVDITDYNILNVDGDSVSLKYFWGAPVRDSLTIIPSRDARRKLFNIYHPYIAFEDIPDELILCCDNSDKISQSAARLQIERVEKNRDNITAHDLDNMIKVCCEKQYLGVAGQEKVNIVMLNQRLNQ